MHRLRQGVQSIVESDHPFQEAHRLQTFRLRPLRASVPAKG
nr:unnamed protein product [Callosobruchus chinensis]